MNELPYVLYDYIEEGPNKRILARFNFLADAIDFISAIHTSKIRLDYNNHIIWESANDISLNMIARPFDFLLKRALNYVI